MSDNPSDIELQHAYNLTGASPQLKEDGDVGKVSRAAFLAFFQTHALNRPRLSGRDNFFASIRASLFGVLTQGVVDGLNAILDKWAEDPQPVDVRHIAYSLATTYLETAHTMQPIAEIGHGKGHPYGVADKTTGQTYYGRGFVQLTWKQNYELVSDNLGLNLVNKPDDALQLPVAAAILRQGMTEGWFTGKKLADFFTTKTDDPVNARQIINRLDAAEEIAGYHAKFLAALKA